MFTDTARHQPHLFHPTRSPFDHVNPYDVSAKALSRKCAHGRNGASQGEGARGNSERHHQYAHPLQGVPSSSFRPQIANQSAQRTEASEHMLRRKTPNGTLAAGYDGTPVEWTTRPHASKHLLMPVSNRGGQSPYASAAAGRRDKDIPVNRSAVLSRADEQQHRAWGQNVVSPQSHYAPGPAVDGDYIYGGQRQNPLPSPPLDSRMDEGSLSQHLYSMTGTQQVPTVLQPMWPPCIGPTASNDQGPFGPYWPDGAFVPYRPAALRDPRYNIACRKNNMEDSVHMQEANHNRGDWMDGSSSSTYRGHSDSDWQKCFGKSTRQPVGNYLFTKIDQLSQKPEVFLDETVYCPRSPRHTSLSYSGKNRSLASDTLQASYNRNNAPLSSPPHSAQSNSPMFQESGVYTNNLQFKEKALVWAHRIYMNLLASLHQTRRNALNKQHLHSDLRNTRPRIYPKPPRQLFYASQSSNAMRNTDAQELKGHPQPASIGTFGHRYHPPNTIATLDNEPDNYVGPLWPPFKGGLSHYEEQALKNSHFGSQTPSLSHTLFDLRKSVPYFGRPPASATDLAQDQHTESPSCDARAALDLLGRLCKESGWKWTEGMLLGGCLAYGLGEYNKAWHWYSHVLSCDPNNVEAISNMAATLLSLNRRNDAEQYWLRSVRLRPGYFEAVEHLVGLLCGDQRGKEAVRIIEFVEQALRHSHIDHYFGFTTHDSDPDTQNSRSPSASTSEISHNATSDNETSKDKTYVSESSTSADSGSSGYAIPGSDNGRMLALVHAKGNMLYALGDNAGAAKAFEDAILIGAGRRHCGINGLIKQILRVFADHRSSDRLESLDSYSNCEPILLLPEVALKTAHFVFPPHGQLPGLKEVPAGVARKAAISTTSNSLLSLAKIYQDGMSSSGATAGGPKAASGVQDILALYYLSLSLQPSPSTANNVGILLASVQQSTAPKSSVSSSSPQTPIIPGVIPGSGIALALAYYNYGLNLDPRHAHLYTNLGSLLKDIGQLSAAIKMYEQAVACDGKFDIALANLANAVKDQGRISDAIGYYQRAVTSNPDFAEAVCGLANALNSVCSWKGRGGVVRIGSKHDRWHVDEQGMLLDARMPNNANSGWIGRVVAIVEKQLNDGQTWGRGVIQSIDASHLLTQFYLADGWTDQEQKKSATMLSALENWAGQRWEGAKVIRLVERATKRLGWQMYQDRYVRRTACRPKRYARPQLPAALAAPSAPTVLPFHTFTCPLNAKQIRKISQRNGLRISCSTLRAPWLPAKVFNPPAPPRPCLNVGYISSDFNNHPLAHLMQSVFGFHNIAKVKAFCYATTASDNSVHREQIQREAPVFYDASSWSVDRLVNQVVSDGIHILVNLNGYTRGARNEVFAARPAPIQMSFMGFAGTLGAEWCDYLLADTTAVPLTTLRPCRSNVDLIDQTEDGNNDDEQDDWVYGENIIFTRDTFFCCDHRQSAPDARGVQLSWAEEQKRRWKMREDLFPDLPDNTVILGNFNQLYKIEPTTFRTWLRILSRIPKAVLWLLRFPDLGENNLRQTAVLWAGAEVASRIIFTDVAPKHQHISRARVCDLFLDTPECNAHTTAADVLWSGTPLLTLPRYEYKMCSRMAASILKGALPKDRHGDRAAEDLIVSSDEEYEERAVELGSGLTYSAEHDVQGFGRGRLVELRELLYKSRWTSALFDTRRWVKDLEGAYEEAWRRWVAGEGGDIWL